MKIKFGLAELGLLGGIVAALASVRFHYRVKNRLLPSLQDDVVYSGGKYIPTEEYVEILLPNLYFTIPLCVVIGVLNYILLKDRESDRKIIRKLKHYMQRFRGWFES